MLRAEKAARERHEWRNRVHPTRAAYCQVRSVRFLSGDGGYLARWQSTGNPSSTWTSVAYPVIFDMSDPLLRAHLSQHACAGQMLPTGDAFRS